MHCHHPSGDPVSLTEKRAPWSVGCFPSSLWTWPHSSQTILDVLAFLRRSKSPRSCEQESKRGLRASMWTRVPCGWDVASPSGQKTHCKLEGA